MIIYKTQTEKHILNPESHGIMLCGKTISPDETTEVIKHANFKQEQIGMCKDCLAVAYKNLADHINKEAY